MWTLPSCYAIIALYFTSSKALCALDWQFIPFGTTSHESPVQIVNNVQPVSWKNRILQCFVLSVSVHFSSCSIIPHGRSASRPNFLAFVGITAITLLWITDQACKSTIVHPFVIPLSAKKRKKKFEYSILSCRTQIPMLIFLSESPQKSYCVSHWDWCIYLLDTRCNLQKNILIC